MRLFSAMPHLIMEFASASSSSSSRAKSADTVFPGMPYPLPQVTASVLGVSVFIFVCR